jgi:hypothetical protein
MTAFVGHRVMTSETVLKKCMNVSPILCGLFIESAYLLHLKFLQSAELVILLHPF